MCAQACFWLSCDEQRGLFGVLSQWPLGLGAQVGAQTETELKEKKLRVEDALNATKVCAHPC